MKHPPYHLRPNKAVDRLILLEAIKKLGFKMDLSEYTYYGFGGPYLEEFRLLYEMCPELQMVSFEKDNDTFKRQKFHLPCGSLRLENKTFRSFLTHNYPLGEKSIIWLDYTNLDLGAFEDFQMLLSQVANDSMIKITLRAEPRDYLDEENNEFMDRFEAFLPAYYKNPPRAFDRFAKLIQDMLRIAMQKMLPASTGLSFQPLTSFYYSDTVGIFTLTGIVCQNSNAKRFRELFKEWKVANLFWGKPKRINVPYLSTKERLHLQRHLPCEKRAGQILVERLGYCIDWNKSKSAAMLNQYADYHRYFPHFINAIP